MAEPLRVYLTGHVCIEAGSQLLEGQALGGRQGRLALAYLVAERARAVTRDELVSLLWHDDPPKSWETSLSAVMSNLRKALSAIGLSRGDVIDLAFGCYQLRLPTTSWVDVEAAAQAIDQAEGAFRAGDIGAAFGGAGVATAIARRAFLPGENGGWVERRRGELCHVMLRGLDCFVKVFIERGECQLAIKAATEAVDIAPCREVGYSLLMEAQAAAGNRSESLRVYHRCRAMLAEELGIDPSPQTEATYLGLLRLGM